MSVIVNPTAASAGGITQLTGDVAAGPGSGSQAATLASIITAGGPIGDSTHTPVITWDAKGRLTAVSSALISGGGGGMAIGGTVTSGTPGSVLFIGTGPVLAQDNANFFFDDTNFILKLGHSGSTTAAYFINGVPAVYEVTNASGNNWFEANSGNLTLTGNSNLGTGDSVLVNLTTGSRNLAIGSADSFFGNTAGSITTGSDNTVFGVSALALCVTGNQNFALGSQSLRKATGSNNVGIGFHALNQVTTQENNVAIGTNAGDNLTTGNGGNILFGFSAGGNINTGDSNVIIQANPSALGPSGSATRNVIIGSLAAAGGFGGAFGAGNDNIFIGYTSGFALTGGSSSNIIIGAWQGPSGTMNNVFGIGMSDNHLRFDYNHVTSEIWSIQNTTTSQGLHIYNTLDDVNTPTNWERAALSWRDTTNTFRIESQVAGTGVVRIIAIDGFSKAGAPANTDLPSGTWALINDTSGNQTWLVYNNAGTIRKVQLT